VLFIETTLVLQWLTLQQLPNPKNKHPLDHVYFVFFSQEDILFGVDFFFLFKIFTNV